MDRDHEEERTRRVKGNEGSSEVIVVVRGLARFWLTWREVMVGEGGRMMLMMSEKEVDESI